MNSQDQEGSIVNICETLVQRAISLNVIEIEKDEQPEQINSSAVKARCIGRHHINPECHICISSTLLPP